MKDLVYVYDPTPEDDPTPAGVTPGWIYIGSPKVGATLIGIKAAVLHDGEGSLTIVGDGEPFEAVVIDG